MRLYFAGNIGLTRIEALMHWAGCRNRLVTYADRDVRNHASAPQVWIEMRTPALARRGGALTVETA